MEFLVGRSREIKGYFSPSRSKLLTSVGFRRVAGEELSGRGSGGREEGTGRQWHQLMR